MTSPAIQRLTKRAQFLFVRNGLRASRPSLTLEARRRAAAGPIGLGLTASKKVGSAVVRNRARRRLREAARRLLPEHGVPGVDYVLVARPLTSEVPWPQLLDDLGNALISVRAKLKSGAGDRRPSRTPVGARGRHPTESD
jgi:ribonuclease P protein component